MSRSWLTAVLVTSPVRWCEWVEIRIATFF